MTLFALILLISLVVGGIAGLFAIDLAKALREEEKRLGMFGVDD